MTKIMTKLRDFLGLGPSEREQERRAQAYQQLCLQQRYEVEKQMFLKLLQTMCETYEQQKLCSWYHYFGGWNPGPTVRAFNTTPISPIFEIHHESSRSNSNYYNISVCQCTPKFEKIYQERCFVPDNQTKYVDAVFDLVQFGPNALSPKTQQTLQKLKNITDKHPVIWDNHKETRAICYLKTLQKSK